MSKRIRRAVPLFLLAALLLTMAGPAYAAEGGGLSAEEYDLEGLASGKYDWETDLQLLEVYEPNVIIIKFRNPGEFPGREKQYEDAVAKVLGSGVKVALVDTGYSGNSDLPQVSGYSVYNKNTDLNDLNGHGTQVAGTLGAVGCNGAKGAGVVWNANILPVKVSESSTVTVANVSSAIIYAADHGAQIINLSLSFPSDSATLRNAVDYAFDRGCLLVTATGNNGDGVWDPQSGYGTIDMAKTLGAALALSDHAPAAEEPKEPVPPPVAEEGDTTPPILTLRGSSVIELTEGDTYEEPGYSASDDRDGDLTRSVTVSGTASTAYAGEYTLV